MIKDTHTTDVIFRVDTTKDWKGTVFALLPHEVSDHSGNVTSYQHVGQHCSADYHHCIRNSRPATNDECKDLKAEMEGLGYDLNIVRRIDTKKYLKSYYERRK